jgi:hypothetical protein
MGGKRQGLTLASTSFSMNTKCDNERLDIMARRLKDESYRNDCMEAWVRQEARPDPSFQLPGKRMLYS